ncbi:MAG: hypothetical protein N5P05_001358 [Chroococcopsis gigantea SAG 12.99]|jgi:hypothetical protein|nr:DUF2996 domain-containing protein [Chlorogloea purpurea SAG 13.99]MDV2999752.1 hypothetical protein [Chroococcopsis gigantea SAG 12.99]
MSEETAPKPEAEVINEAKAPKEAPPKKAKQPTVEDKPFEEFIQQDFTPALDSALKKQGLADVSLALKKDKIAVKGSPSNEDYWQIAGKWQDRQFNLYFIEGDIGGKKAFSYSEGGGKASTLESFMIDERKVTLDTLLMYTLQRLNGQKWLRRN